MTRLSVKVVPGASQSRIMGKYGEGIKVQVSAAPEKGKANAAVIKLLAAELGVRPGQITLISGAAQPRKVFQFDGIDDGELAERLNRALSGRRT